MSQGRTSSKRAIIVTGGQPLSNAAIALLPIDAAVIAADSGLDHALAAGLRPVLVVGDLDSVSDTSLALAREMGIPIQEHPPDKDDTDTELAIAAALASGADDLMLVSGGGDRLDHSIGALSALGHPSLAGCGTVTALWGDALVFVLHGPRTRDLAIGAGITFSLLALHGTCTGVTLRDARWPLTDAVIEPASSLGVSNVAVSTTVRITIATGVLTVIVPQFIGDPS